MNSEFHPDCLSIPFRRLHADRVVKSRTDAWRIFGESRRHLRFGIARCKTTGVAATCNPIVTYVCRTVDIEVPLALISVETIHHANASRFDPHIWRKRRMPELLRIAWFTWDYVAVSRLAIIEVTERKSSRPNIEIFMMLVVGYRYIGYGQHYVANALKHFSIYKILSSNWSIKRFKAFVARLWPQS